MELLHDIEILNKPLKKAYLLLERLTCGGNDVDEFKWVVNQGIKSSALQKDTVFTPEHLAQTVNIKVLPFKFPGHFTTDFTERLTISIKEFNTLAMQLGSRKFQFIMRDVFTITDDLHLITSNYSDYFIYGDEWAFNEPTQINTLTLTFANPETTLQLLPKQVTETVVYDGIVTYSITFTAVHRLPVGTTKVFITGFNTTLPTANQDAAMIAYMNRASGVNVTYVDASTVNFAFDDYSENSSELIDPAITGAIVGTVDIVLSNRLFVIPLEITYI